MMKTYYFKVSCHKRELDDRISLYFAAKVIDKKKVPRGKFTISITRALSSLLQESTKDEFVYSTEYVSHPMRGSYTDELAQADMNVYIKILVNNVHSAVKRALAEE